MVEGVSLICYYNGGGGRVLGRSFYPTYFTGCILDRRDATNEEATHYPFIQAARLLRLGLVNLNQPPLCNIFSSKCVRFYEVSCLFN